MDKKKRKIPALRFPEFDGEWKECNLGRVINLKRGYDLPKRSRVDGNVPIISSSGIAGFHNEEKVKGPGVVTGRYGTIGSVFYLKENFWPLNTSLYVQDFKGNHIKFVYFLLRNFDFGLFSGKSAVPGINRNHVHEAQINIPTLPEQQKIAGFLTAVDDKINQLTRKKTLLEQYKKGVMQKIFSQEIRFKDDEGKDFPEWDEKKVAQMVLEKRGAMKIGPFGSQLKKNTFVKDGLKVYGQENIFNNDFDYGDRFITEEHFEQLRSNELFEGDFVISTMGTIGKSAVVPPKIKRGIMDSHMIRLQLNKKTINSIFVAQVFDSFVTQKQVKRLSVGGIMDGLSMGIIKKLKFKIPSLPEQQKIADFLSGIDKKIEQVDFQLEKTKEWKKGLLQQMFV